MHDNFLAYRHYIWGKLTLLSTLILVGVYYWGRQWGTPNGGTALGLTYGILGFIAILSLMYYGRRKRLYTARHWSLRSWLSFHVYVGMMTLILVPLHAGFKFGVDIHTLAYVLLVIVVVSGIIGSALYLSIPRRFGQYGRELTYDNSSDEELGKIIRDMRKLAVDKSQAFAEICQAEIEYGLPKKHAGWGLLWRKPLVVSALTRQMQDFEAYLARIPDVEHEPLHSLARLATQKRDLEQRLVSQMYLQNLLEAWLYIHLPVSIVMFILIIVHIVSMFYYGYVVSY
jgi:hypothetical protein